MVLGLKLLLRVKMSSDRYHLAIPDRVVADRDVSFPSYYFGVFDNIFGFLSRIDLTAVLQNNYPCDCSTRLSDRSIPFKAHVTKLK